MEPLLKPIEIQKEKKNNIKSRASINSFIPREFSSPFKCIHARIIGYNLLGRVYTTAESTARFSALNYRRHLKYGKEKNGLYFLRCMR